MLLIDGHGYFKLIRWFRSKCFSSANAMQSRFLHLKCETSVVMQGRADKSIIITTGTFTAEARREASRYGVPAIELIDGDSLVTMLRAA